MISRRSPVKGGKLNRPPPNGGRKFANSRRLIRPKTRRLCGVSLLLSQIANYRQLEHLPLIRLDQKDDPDNERSQPDDHMEWESHKYQPRNKADDREADPYSDQSYTEEDHLEGMEAHE